MAVLVLHFAVLAPTYHVSRCTCSSRLGRAEAPTLRAGNPRLHHQDHGEDVRRRDHHNRPPGAPAPLHRFQCRPAPLGRRPQLQPSSAACRLPGFRTVLESGQRHGTAPDARGSTHAPWTRATARGPRPPASLPMPASPSCRPPPSQGAGRSDSRLHSSHDPSHTHTHTHRRVVPVGWYS